MTEMPSDATIEQIAQVASEADTPITTAQVSAVIAAYHNVTGGDPVGTMRHNPESGAIAIRVNQEGLILWRVSDPNGDFYNDLQPTLDWPEVKI
jgi:hypothetical protein